MAVSNIISDPRPFKADTKTGDASLPKIDKQIPKFPVNIKAVLSDLDGTLIHCDRQDLKKFACCLVEHFGESLTSSEFENPPCTLEELFCLVLNKRDTGGKSSIDKEYFRYECYSQLSKLRDSICEVLPDVESSLAELTRMGIQTAICTAREHRASFYTDLSKIDLSDKVEAIVTRRDPYANGKVKDHIFLEACSTLWVNHKDTIVVGDSIDDMESARRVGIFCVGVLTGLNTAKELYDAGACVVLESFADVPHFILRMRTEKLLDTGFSSSDVNFTHFTA